MENAIRFIKQNVWAVLAGLVFYVTFLFFTFSGNRLCDCESTERYNPGQHSRTSVNRFYHK
ncbi:hypothetical protein [Flavobacterium caeni]|uniref:Uncharacterized protein n=1 Tax=Flavobacterium caeni TaxID=490189 RepID=A0A1G5G7B3_9FLAO|nr:hypothetical protein [Flavobacterium caeni]SCY47432.1 hypothetical protein SAMN02927903_01476 [Flavobacterium caeni]